MRPVVAMVVAGCAAAMGLGCAGVRIVSAPEVAPRQELEVGSRVRVDLVPPRRKVVGNVVRVSADTLVIAPEDGHDELVLSASNVRRVELSLGRWSRAGRAPWSVCLAVQFLELLPSRTSAVIAASEPRSVSRASTWRRPGRRRHRGGNRQPDPNRTVAVGLVEVTICGRA
jgi:hypothetical protein